MDLSKVKYSTLFFVISLFVCQLNGQSLQHPHIWVDASDKQRILNNIAQYDWAESQYNQYVQRQGSRKNSHRSNPSSFISSLEHIPGDRTNHRNHLNSAAECAMLYYLTGDEDYAQVAADVMHQYMKMISVQDRITIKFFNPESDDSHHIQIRELYTRIGITYDFIQPFLSKAGTTVFDLSTGSRVPFNFTTAQQALEVMADNVLLEGGKNSNHPLLELAGGLYVTLCMQNDAKRKSYYDRFWKDEPGQNSITWMLENIPEDSDIWPEAMGYSKEVHDILLRNLMVIDRYDPGRKIIENNKRLLDGAFVFDDFKYPNNRIMAFGDTHRHQSETDFIFRYVLAIANQKGYAEYENRAAAVLKAHYESIGGYKPVIVTKRLNWDTPIDLLWGVNIPESVDAADITYASTGRIKHAGVIMQRNDVEVDNEEYGLMYYTGGATYVHAHANGIDFEIYGSGYVIGPEFGREAYGSDIHEQYAVSPAGHNTVIANGKGGRGAKTNGGSTWQNIVDEVELQACEPKPYEDRIAENFSFSSQYMDDGFNNVEQLRTNSIIRTSPTSGYYVDIFRSKGKSVNNFHDYLFHGLGDDMTITSNDQNLPLNNTPNRYQNDMGDDRMQPGWRWYSEAKTSAATNESVNVRFDLNQKGKYLHVAVPGGQSREYTSALAPPSRYVRDYASKDTRMFIMRKPGEAWNQPFVAIYEPSANAQSTIASAIPLYAGSKNAGVRVISQVGDSEVIDYVISGDSDQTVFNSYGISFKGRFAIVRAEVSGNSTNVSLYVGKGEKLSFEGQEIVGNADGKAYKEFTLDFAYEAPSEEAIVLAAFEQVDVLSIYPNPSDSGIFKLSKTTEYTVFNMGGIRVAHGNGNTIDLSNEPSGIYIFHTNDQVIKLIK